MRRISASSRCDPEHHHETQKSLLRVKVLCLVVEQWDSNLGLSQETIQLSSNFLTLSVFSLLFFLSLSLSLLCLSLCSFSFSSLWCQSHFLSQDYWSSFISLNSITDVFEIIWAKRLTLLRVMSMAAIALHRFEFPTSVSFLWKNVKIKLT